MWAVDKNILYCGDGYFPKGAVEIDEDTYKFIQSNFEVLDLNISEGLLNISINLIAYKNLALAKLKLDNFVFVSGVKIFDYELSILQCMSPAYLANGLCFASAKSVAEAIHKRNKKYHETKAEILSASDPAKVDEALERWQMN